MKKYFFLTFLFLLSGGLFAQTKKPGTAPNPDAKAVEAAVRTLFDAMWTADSVKANTVMASNFRIIILNKNSTGQTVLRETSGKQFRNQMVSRPAQTLDERYWNGQVQVDGDLASYWCQYAFFLKGTFSHCGTDVFQLYRSPEGWKIVNLAYTIQKEACNMKAIPTR